MSLSGRRGETYIHAEAAFLSIPTPLIRIHYRDDRLALKSKSEYALVLKRGRAAAMRHFRSGCGLQRTKATLHA